MTLRRTASLRIATAAAWGVAGADLTPWLDLSGNMALYLIALGCVGAYALITQAAARPMDAVYEAGKAIGRREAMLEQECERVTRMSERRLRVVNGEPSDS